MTPEEIADELTSISDLLEAIPCSREDGYYCRLHFDTDLCAHCGVMLEMDRLHRRLVGRWMGERIAPRSGE